MKVKICGITTVEDALLAAKFGATHIGLNLYTESPRFVTEPQVNAICVALQRLRVPPKIVLVTVNASPKVLETFFQRFPIDAVQLSGDEPDMLLDMLGPIAYKAYRIRPGETLTPHSASSEPHFLLDAKVPGMYGGTGQTVDWPTAAALARQYNLLLAGGLTPDNVADAVRTVKPWGVDVASGVEAAPGIKDREKLHQFITRAREAADGA